MNYIWNYWLLNSKVIYTREFGFHGGNGTSNSPKSRDKVLPANDREVISRFPINSVKLHDIPRRIWIWHTCYAVRKYRLSRSPLAAEILFRLFFRLPRSRVIYESRYPVLCITCMCEDALKRSTTIHCTQNTDERIRARNMHLCPEAVISLEGAGLTGWYCRAGCGRSSHFGDEISLSNPAPCFICSGRSSARWQAILLISFNKLHQLSSREVHHRITKWRNIYEEW